MRKDKPEIAELREKLLYEAVLLLLRSHGEQEGVTHALAMGLLATAGKPRILSIYQETGVDPVTALQGLPPPKSPYRPSPEGWGILREPLSLLRRGYMPPALPPDRRSEVIIHLTELAHFAPMYRAFMGRVLWDMLEESPPPHPPEAILWGLGFLASKARAWDRKPLFAPWAL